MPRKFFGEKSFLPSVKYFLCCAPLEAGTTIIGVLSMVGLFILVPKLQLAVNLLNINWSSFSGGVAVAATAHLASSALNVLGMLAAICLLFGRAKRKAGYLTPFMVVTVARIVLGIIVCLLYAGHSFQTDLSKLICLEGVSDSVKKSDQSIVLYGLKDFTLLFDAAVHVHFLLVVNSYYTAIKRVDRLVNILAPAFALRALTEVTRNQPETPQRTEAWPPSYEDATRPENRTTGPQGSNPNQRGSNVANQNVQTSPV